MTDPTSPLLKNWNLSMEKTDPPPTIENFTFQIWSGYRKMTNHPNFHRKCLNFRFGLDMERWLTPYPHQKFQISDSGLDWPPILTKNFNFRFGLDMERWLTPNPHWNILNFRFSLDMERWLTPQPHQNFKFQIQPGHGKMTNPPPSPKI